MCIHTDVESWRREQNRPSRVRPSVARAGRFVTVGVLTVLFVVSVATAQVSYTFTSGPGGDGFNWPASPTGLLNGDSFSSPDGVDFANYTGNTVFFDGQYQVAGNAPGITGDALWGNPLESGFGSLEMYFFSVDLPQTVAFDFAWSAAGSPGATPDSVWVYLEDSEGRGTDVFWVLTSTFIGLGGFDGYADRLGFDAAILVDDYFNNDGGPFIDIAWIVVNTGDIATGGSASEFALDNFDVDGETGGGGEVFPSVNGGSIDVTGVILARSALRGIGLLTAGIEITNGSTRDTTVSTQLVPGGGLTDNGQASNIPVLAGQTVWSGNIVSIDKSLPSETYDSDVVVINDGDPFDPDNTVTLRVRLVEAPDLTAPSPVHVTAGQTVRLINAAAPTGGHRASAKMTGTSITGPFAVSGYDVGTPVKPAEMIEGNGTFDRYGRLSGSYDGTLTASLEMTFFVDPNNDIEVFLDGAEPMPDEQWTLEATLADTPADDGPYALSDDLGPGLVGVNSVTTAATILGGTAAATGSVSMDQGPPPIGASTGVIGEAAVVDFSTAVPVHVVQMTYRDEDLCATITEANLRLLYFDGIASDWQYAVNGNSDGGAGATFFAGSFNDFLTTLGGAPLSTALGGHGVDTVNNHVWAILDHESTFGTGEIGEACGIPGDFDNDGDVDLDDFAMWVNCAGGPASGVTPGCGMADFNGDGDADLADFAAFMRAFGSV